ncbi:MAG TPA: hypothetical protein VII23_24650, partial [Terriglobales bacterium]
MTASTGGHAHLGEPASSRGITIGVVALLVLLVVGAVSYFWMRPEPVPKVSNFVQLTHDGQPKFLVGTEGSRLYLGLINRQYTGMAEMSTAGGEPKQLPILPSLNMNPLSL